jgi:hypothetical protein
MSRTAKIKTCPRCKERPKVSKTVRYCAECKRTIARDWAQRNREKCREACRRTREANPGYGKAAYEKKRAKLESEGHVFRVRQGTRRQQVLDALVSEADACIRWVGAHNQDEYGVVYWDGKSRHVHNIVLELKLGRPIAEDLETLHTCHVRDCYNPRHLREGSHIENVREGVALGHWNVPRPHNGGSEHRHGSRRYTPDTVREARRLFEVDRQTKYRISKDLGISRGALSKMLTRETWSDL